MAIISTAKFASGQFSFADIGSSGQVSISGVGFKNGYGLFNSIHISGEGGDASAAWGIAASSAFFMARSTRGAAGLSLWGGGPWSGPNGTVSYYNTLSGNFTNGSFKAPFSDWLNNTGIDSIRTGNGGDVKVTVTVNSGQTAYGVAAWGPAGQQRPGLQTNKKRPDTSGTPESPAPGLGYCNDHECSVDPNDTQIAGASLTALPVSGDFGVTQPVYYAGIGAGRSGPYSPTRYLFGSMTGLSFTSFGTGAAVPGDISHIEIDDGTSVTPYVPGTTHVFSTPVTSFVLRGVDANAMPPDDQPVPFDWSATYDSAGPAIVFEEAFKVPTLPGDFNRDGFIDAADFVTWRKAGGTTADYNTWRASFGTNLNGTAGQALSSVPEPASFLPFALGILAWCLSLRTRRCTKPGATISSPVPFRAA